MRGYRSRAILAGFACVIAACAILTAACAILTTSQAEAAPSVRLAASFSPERLGKGTTIQVGFHVVYPSDEAPLAATGIQFFLPRGLGIATSELGLDSCQPAQLELLGRAACPPNSLMGHGSATAAVPFGSHFVVEHTSVTLFSGPVVGSNPQLLFVTVGESPVIAEVIFSALVLPAGPRFGGLIETKLPLVPSVPYGPDIALLGLQTTIGPAGIVYREDIDGRTVNFRPRGILLPKSCPRGGFPFAVHLSFSDGSGAGTDATVPCPHRAPPAPAHTSTTKG
ncbi:MAG TPA: hypothetical protein VGP18_11150 [Solirubrobacteraceae bacterium]|jgi:hypothetical protein|nr:hypothetical protein [Solirubrobacteraceae bacterium]